MKALQTFFIASIFISASFSINAQAATCYEAAENEYQRELALAKNKKEEAKAQMKYYQAQANCDEAESFTCAGDFECSAGR